MFLLQILSIKCLPHQVGLNDHLVTNIIITPVIEGGRKGKRKGGRTLLPVWTTAGARAYSREALQGRKQSSEQLFCFAIQTALESANCSASYITLFVIYRQNITSF